MRERCKDMIIKRYSLCPKQTKIIPKQTFLQFLLVNSDFFRILVPVMYTLKDFLTSVIGMSGDDVPSDEMYCSESNTQLTFLTNLMQETLAGYSYTLVRKGWLKLIYGGSELLLQEGDLLIYSPGIQISIVSGSTDYRSVCLIVDERVALEIPNVRNVILTAYQPLVELGCPVIHFNAEQAEHFWQHMHEIIEYLHSSHRYLQESLRTLFSQFILDLMDVVDKKLGPGQISERSAELFIAFVRQLTLNFVEHHDLQFYANHLHVTTIHLSRVVRQVSGRTVADYINQMLLLESLWLLKTTNLPLSIIAERLHFSDQSSFGRFFLRMRGISPKQYRAVSA